MEYAYRNKFIICIAKIVDFCGNILFFVKRRKGATSQINTILIIKLDHLGDCFLLTPIFEYLKNGFPNVDIDVLCQKSCEPIFARNPNIHNIFTFNYWRFHRGESPDGLRVLLSFIKKNRKKYDLVIDARGEPIVALTSFLLGAKYRIGFSKEEVGEFFYTQKISWSREEPEWKKYVHLLDFLKISASSWNPKIFLTKEELEVVSSLLPQKDFLVAGIGAGAEYKKYPIQNYIEIFNEIKKKKDISIVVLGSAEEKKDGNTFTSGIGVDSYNYVGSCDIRISYGILSYAVGFIGNDSVLAHFSGSFNIPTIELMSCINNEKRWGAVGEKTKVFVGFSPSHKCPIDSCPSCPHMLAISKSEILSVALQCFNDK